MKVHLIENISEIPQGQYQGYYWCSGAKSPVMVNGLFELTLDNNSLYIQEAMLWDPSKKISIMIQFTHRPIIMSYNLSDVKDDTIARDSIAYISHRIEGKSKLRFYQHWEEEPDPFCDGMPVLKMKAQIFIGFE